MRIRIDIDMQDVLQSLERSNRNIGRIVKQAVNNCVDDLIRTSSEAAPHDHGVLEKSWAKDIKVSSLQVEAEVTYSVKESDENGNHFNYALWTHEADYNLGPGSQSKPGGTGMSGNHYPVGNKYIARPLEGEKEAYKEHIVEALRNEMGGGT